MAKSDTIASVALPKVAFNKPPTVEFVYKASCSVMKPRRSASGQIESSAKKKVHPSLHRELRWGEGA
jgi:hypothetical protein